MVENNQLALYMNNWNPLLVPATFQAYLQFAQADDATAYADPVDDEAFQNTLDSLNRLFSFQPGTVIETLADYLSGRNTDGVWKHQRRDFVSSNPVSLIAPNEGLTQGEARDHCVHLETIILAKEQDAPTANAVGQILISGRAAWMKLKGKLLSSFSRRLRSRSAVGLRIAFADAAQA